MGKLLEFKNVTKTFPGVKALDDVSLDLNPGEVHVIVGKTAQESPP
jgi:ABC-type sugar transport system ATPase subunit